MHRWGKGRASSLKHPHPPPACAVTESTSSPQYIDEEILSCYSILVKWPIFMYMYSKKLRTTDFWTWAVGWGRGRLDRQRCRLRWTCCWDLWTWCQAFVSRGPCLLLVGWWVVMIICINDEMMVYMYVKVNMLQMCCNESPDLLAIRVYESCAKDIIVRFKSGHAKISSAILLLYTHRMTTCNNTKYIISLH